jgi:surface protein
MFYNASNFNQPIEKWDVSNVNIIDMMFANPDEIDEIEFDDELHTNQFDDE